MKTLEVYLVPGTASGFLGMTFLRLSSANEKKKFFEISITIQPIQPAHLI